MRPGRVGYVIGTKQLPRAVDRNRLRRMLREAIRARRPALSGLRHRAAAAPPVRADRSARQSRAKPPCCWTSSNVRPADEDAACRSRSRLPVHAPAAARRALPFLSELLGVRPRRDRAPRRRKRVVASLRRVSSLPSVSSRRLRPGPLIAAVMLARSGHSFMDTQRLILFVDLFVLGALPLGALAGGASPAASFRAGGEDNGHESPAPAASKPAGGGGCSDGRLCQAGRAVRPRARRIAIKTDRYVADVDTLGGVINAARADRPSRHATTRTSPTRCCRRTTNRTFVAQSGLIGDGLPNHHTLWQALPGPRELAPGADKLELKLAATAANGDKVTQTLTFHRGSYVIDVSYEVTNTGSTAASPYRVFPVHPRHQDAGRAKLMGAVLVHRPGALQRGRQVQEDRIRRHRQGQGEVHRQDRQRLDRHGRALFRRRLAARRTPTRPRASSTSRSSTTVFTPTA